MRKWEYWVMPVEHTALADVEAELNAAGKEGWELVQLLVAEMPMRAGAVGLVLKRELDSYPR